VLRLGSTLSGLLASVLLVALLSCAKKTETAAGEKHYSLKGRVLALNEKSRTATVDAAAIPNFMEAMTMEYPVKSDAEFKKLHVNENITATVNVSSSGDEYNLSNIQPQSPGK
jgi:Cu/Ag efflux protein CusF